MGYRVEWLDEREMCVVVAPVGQWDWQEFQQAFREVHALIATKDYTVDYIADLTGVTNTPGPGLLGNARNVYRHRAPNRGMAVVVSAPGAVQLVLELLAKVLGTTDDFEFVATFEDAVAAVNERQSAHGE